MLHVKHCKFNKYMTFGRFFMYMNLVTTKDSLPPPSYIDTCVEEHIPWDDCTHHDEHTKIELPACYYVLEDARLYYVIKDESRNTYNSTYISYSEFECLVNYHIPFQDYEFCCDCSKHKNCLPMRRYSPCQR